MNNINVEQRAIGSQGLRASCQGLGLMGMTAFYETKKGEEVISEEEKINIIGATLDLGINLIDTAWVYQNFSNGDTNEALLGKALKKFGRERFVVATKFGIVFTIEGGKPQIIISGKPDFIRKQLSESLQRLGTDYIDLYYMHRMDPTTPIEETMACLLELHKEGKIRYVGLSECTPEELERAHKVMPVTAVQLEWSLNTRNVEKKLVPTCRKLGVGIVAYSPLGRGLLTSGITKSEDLSDTDFRKKMPRFNEENFQKNIDRTKKLEDIAKKKGISVAQLALAWVHNQGKDVFPIPGSTKLKRITENANAVNVVLDENERKEIEDLIGESHGERYDESVMYFTFERR